MMALVIASGAAFIAAFALGGAARLWGGRGHAALLGGILALGLLAGWSVRFGWPPVFPNTIQAILPWTMLAALIAGVLLDRLNAPLWGENAAIALLAAGCGAFAWLTVPPGGAFATHALIAGTTGALALVVLWRLRQTSARPAVCLISLGAAFLGLGCVALLKGLPLLAAPALLTAAGIGGVFPWAIHRTERLSPALFLTAGCGWLSLAHTTPSHEIRWSIVILLTVFFAEAAFAKRNNSNPKDEYKSKFLFFGAITAACILSIFVALLVAYVGQAISGKP